MLKREELDEIALNVAEEHNLILQDPCGCSECRERDKRKIVAFAHALLCEVQKRLEVYEFLGLPHKFTPLPLIEE